MNIEQNLTPLEVEKEIDEYFINSPLLNIGYSQAIWSLLSALEDRHLKLIHIDNLPNSQLHVQLDTLMNSVTHPIRALYKNNKRLVTKLNRKFVDEDYSNSQKWLDLSVQYNEFCSIFPLFHNGKIEIAIEGRHINIKDWMHWPKQYEAYNRLVRKDGTDNRTALDQEKIMRALVPNISCKPPNYDLNLNPKLVQLLIDEYSRISSRLYTLPDSWQCSAFSFGEFRAVYTIIQAILFARFTARSFLAVRGLTGMGYLDGVWVVTLNELETRISRYSGLSIKSVRAIIKYLTFGSMGIRTPDIAIQPIVDLQNGFLALSPFVWNNSNSERNFCVLLNQVESERHLYSRLTQEKEQILRQEIIGAIAYLGYEIRFGDLDDSDLDLAIVDSVNKQCICFELKWFIEPAEIRETIQKSKELEKGVSQALNILKKYQLKNKKLINHVLKIDSNYRFVVAVGSRNWIGGHSVQSDKVPIIKIKHFIEKLIEHRDLTSAIDWLENRKYLPAENIDYKITTNTLQVAKYTSEWYGIKPIEQ